MMEVPDTQKAKSVFLPVSIPALVATGGPLLVFGDSPWRSSQASMVPAKAR